MHVLPRSFPQKINHDGRYVRLEPLDERHIPDLWQAAQGADESWRYLRYGPFANIEALQTLVLELAERVHQPFWTVVDKADGKAKGWLSICDVYPAESAVEIGSIWFSPALQRSRAATEAVFLLMQHLFVSLQYQRLVWRCLDDNLASRHAAQRYGFVFEGIWRRGAIVKGMTKDVRWHSLLCDEWPRRYAALRSWLAADNFDSAGRAIRRLSDIETIDKSPLSIQFVPADPSDFETLVALRIAAMRPSLERIGRFDPLRARERFRAGFAAENTHHIVLNDQRIGFIVVRLSEDHMSLDHLYIHPDHQQQGIGSLVLGHIFAQADTASLAIKVGALRGSDANRFYQKNGFIFVAEEEWDIYYVRPAIEEAP